MRQSEAGAKVPTLPVFVSLCQALRVSPNYLLPDLAPMQEQQDQDMDALLTLWQTATPKQLRLLPPPPRPPWNPPATDL